MGIWSWIGRLTMTSGARQHPADGRQSPRHSRSEIRRRSNAALPALVERLESRLTLSAAPVVSAEDVDELLGDASLSIQVDSYSASRVLLQFRDETPAAEIDRLLSSFTDDFVELSALQLYCIDLQIGVSVDQALAWFRSSTYVEQAEPDYQLKLDSVPTPSDSFWTDMWGLNNIGQNGGTFDADIDAFEAWQTTTGNRNIIVAVIDTGIDYNHPDLASNIWVNANEIADNGIDDDGNGYIDDIHGYDFANDDADPMDDNGHGTHVAGTIGAIGNNSRGVAGVAWNVTLMPLKFLSAQGAGFVSDAVRAINYAVANGAQISNNSWSGGGFSTSLFQAISRAKDAGHLFVAAAGNSGALIETSPAYPAAYSLDNVLAVAATDRNDQLASFSNYGQFSVDVGAPGASIISTYKGGLYATGSGTSMAAPHVAGAAALVWGMHPEWTYEQVIEQIMGTVDPLVSLDGMTLSGGRLNAASAVGTPVFAVDDFGNSDATAATLSNNSELTGRIENEGDQDWFRLSVQAGSVVDFSIQAVTLDNVRLRLYDRTGGASLGTFSSPVGSDGKWSWTADRTGTIYVQITSSDNLGTYRLSARSQSPVPLNPVPTLSIDDRRTAERDSGTRAAVHTVTLSQASGKTVTVNYTTVQSGNAVAGVDYVHVTGQVTFLEGETTKDIFVPIISDLFNEDEETFTIVLSSPVNATISDAEGLGTIVDNDPVPTFTINDVTIAPDPVNAALTATFNVTLSQASGKTVTVDYATANGTATAGSDYTAKLGTLTFTPGTKTLTVTVNVAGLTFKEVDETFFVNLTNAVNAGILDNQGQATIQGDTLVVKGTGLNDIFNLTINPTIVPSPSPVTGNHTLTINGVVQNIPASRYRFLTLDGLAGNDSLFITGTPNSEQATLDPGQVKFVSPLVTVDGVSFSTIDITGNGGNDTADLNDSVENDVFTGTPTTGNMVGLGFNNIVRGFSFVQGLSYAGGFDVANLYDSTGDDKFVGKDTRSQMRGNNFYNSVSRFEQVNAFADMGGFDVALLFGSTGDDTLVSRPDRTSLQGTGFENIANRFDNVYSYAVAGGNDTAKIFDSAGNDRYVGTANTGTMSGMIGGNAYFNQAIDFQLLAVIASTGHDEADLRDIKTLDTVFGSGSDLMLIRNGQQEQLTSFDIIVAQVADNQTPRRILNDVDYAFVTIGTWL